MRRPSFLWMIFLVFCMGSRAEQADPVFRAMELELARAQADLRLPSVPAPFFIEYRVFDIDEFNAGASFGALTRSLRNRTRAVFVTVRVGDYKQDSVVSGAEGLPELLPVDDDILALRRQLWLATDRAFKAAAEALPAKRARLQHLSVDRPVDDFAKATPVQSMRPLAQLQFEPKIWTDLLQSTSALYRGDPEIQAFTSDLMFRATNRYLLNTEGTRVRSGASAYELRLACRTQAADGMLLARDGGFEVNDPKNLPSAETVLRKAADIANSLGLLRQAPVVDDAYRGPVLLSADASAAVFETQIARRIVGVKPPLGSSARVSGDFASSFKSRVLPEFLTVSDDPSLTTFAGKPLLGHYDIDDEGVRAQKVAVVEKGTLVRFLLGRRPIRDFPESNGHSRARQIFSPAGPAVGNLIVEALQPVADTDLKARLIEMCKQRDLPYGYYAATLGGGSPRLLYRVWAKDGHEELVRGAVFGDLDTRSLRSGIVAAGNSPYVANISGFSPHSVAAPALLFDDLEIKRDTGVKDKLPEYPAPVITR